MLTQPVHILLADEHENGRLIFKQAFEEIKIKTNVIVVEDKEELLNHFIQPNIILPQVVILEKQIMLSKTGIICLKEIKKTNILVDIPVAVYSNSVIEKEIEKDIEEVLVKGANIYIKEPRNVGNLKNVLLNIIKLISHYHYSGLNKDNFLLAV